MRKPIVEEREVQLAGRVVRDLVDAGSKSERHAVKLETEGGKRFTLRLRDEPAFGRSALEDLVDKAVSVHGMLIDQVLIIWDWDEQP